MKTLLRLLPFLLLTLSACQSGVRDRAAAVDDIREALVRFALENNASGGQQGVDYYFLSFQKEDPSAEFLARFEGHEPQVLPVSVARSNTQGSVGHSDGGRGLIFSIGEIEWLSKAKVKVEWGYYEANLSASGNIATLEYGPRGWTVTHDEMTWIS